MWSAVTKFARTIVAAATLIGILYLPADLGGLPEALKIPLEYLMAVDRELALIVFSGLLVAYIGWMDARPFILSWQEKRKKHPLEFSLTGNVFDWEQIGGKTYTVGYFEAENLLDTSIEGVEVYLSKIHLPKGGYHSINRRLCRSGSEETKFDILPGQLISIKLFRFEPSGTFLDQGKVNTSSWNLEFGPHSDGLYLQAAMNGAYKLDVSIYGKTYQLGMK